MAYRPMLKMLLGATLAVLPACGSGDLFFVSREGADMPVWVRGGDPGGTLILYVHGGPGGSAYLDRLYPVFAELEEAYAMAYWDQRATGLSQGDPAAATFTLESFVKDMGLVVDSLHTKHQPDRLVLMGHHWGGALAIAYLATGDNQAQADGLVLVDSSHNLASGIPLSVDWLIDYAQGKIDAGEHPEAWQEALAWLRANRDTINTIPQYQQLATYYNVPGPNARWRNPALEALGNPSAGDLFLSPLALSVFLSGGYLMQNVNITLLDLTPAMARITLPAAVMWGRHDGVQPVPMATDAFNALGTPPLDKRLLIYEGSGHYPHVEQREAFSQDLRSFVSSLP